MDLRNVLSQRLLCDKQFATERARHVTDVTMHLDVVVVTAAFVCHKAAAVTAQNGHVAVH